MYVKKFRRMLKEAAEDKSFKAFVENVISSNSIDPSVAAKFLTNHEYEYVGTVFRVQFFPAGEVMNLANTDGTPNKKMISNYLAKSGTLKEGALKLYCKTLEGIRRQLIEPGLYEKEGVDQQGQSISYFGIIFSIDTPSCIDLSAPNVFKNLMDDTRSRLKKTKEVVACDPVSVDPNDIEAIYYKPEGSDQFFLETDLDHVLWAKGSEPISFDEPTDDQIQQGDDEAKQQELQKNNPGGFQ